MWPATPTVKKLSDVSLTVKSSVLETRTRARFEVAGGFHAKFPSFGRPLTILLKVVPPSRLTAISTKSTWPIVRHSMTTPPLRRNFSNPFGERSCRVGARERDACPVFPSNPRLTLPPFGADSLAVGDARSPASIAGEVSASFAKIPPCQLPAVDAR